MIDHQNILASGRRTRYRLQTAGVSINPKAGHAITVGRHGPEGIDFARQVMQRAGEGATEREIDQAIEDVLRTVNPMTTQTYLKGVPECPLPLKTK